MKRSSVLIALLGLALTSSAHADQSVIYKQMRHDAIGTASLAVSPNGNMLRASNLGAGGSDGFRVQLPSQTSKWRAEFFVDLAQGQNVRLNPISNGLPISPMEVTRIDNGYVAEASFTSSEDTVFHLEIADNGLLVSRWWCYWDGSCEPDDGGDEPPGGDPGPGPGGGPGIIIDIDDFWDYENSPALFEGGGFGQESNGDCFHTLVFSSTGNVSVGGMSLGSGNSVTITEASTQSYGRYAYSGFGLMRVQSSAPEIIFVDERAQ